MSRRNQQKRKRKRKGGPTEYVKRFTPVDRVKRMANGSFAILVEMQAPTVVVGKGDEVLTVDSDRLSGRALNRLRGIIYRRKVPTAPKYAGLLLNALLRENEREGCIGDLFETYAERCSQLGKKKADRWIYGQVIRSMLPLLFRLARTVSWLALGEWIKKFIS